MDIHSRIAEVEQKFNTKKAERDQFLNQAEEALTEMIKLQGEFRLLQELSNKPVEPNDIPTEPSVEIVNEGKPKKASK